MRKFTTYILVSLLATTMLLSSCGNNDAVPADNEMTVTTQPTMATIVDVELDTLLTAEEVSEAVGLKMSTPSVSGYGSYLTSIGVDNNAYLNVKFSEQSIEHFNLDLESYADAIPCPNLGESAWYSPVYSQLLVYGKGYKIQAELTGTEDGDMTMHMLRCRQVVSLLLERL